MSSHAAGRRNHTDRSCEPSDAVSLLIRQFETLQYDIDRTKQEWLSDNLELLAGLPVVAFPNQDPCVILLD